MPSFDSPLGQKKFAGQPLREFNVPDASQGASYQHDAPNPNDLEDFQARMEAQNPAQIEQEIRAAKEARQGKERLSDGAKRRIEVLIGMTRTQREADINGTIFVFRSLKSNEMREAISGAAEFDGTVGFSFEMRRQLLARSIINIGGVDIDQFIGSASLSAKLQFVDELDDALLIRLYQEYLDMSKEATSKYAIKTPEQVQEVVADLKK